MDEEPAWRRVIGHEGTFLATVDLWGPDRVVKPRPLQSGYRALWSRSGPDHGAQVLGEGPVDLVDTRSVTPGSSARVAIHPMQPDAWAEVDAGTGLLLLGRTRHHPVVGAAVVLERRGVPASAPLRLPPQADTPSRRRLVARRSPFSWRR